MFRVRSTRLAEISAELFLYGLEIFTASQKGADSLPIRSIIDSRLHGARFPEVMYEFSRLNELHQFFMLEPQPFTVFTPEFTRSLPLFTAALPVFLIAFPASPYVMPVSTPKIFRSACAKSSFKIQPDYTYCAKRAMFLFPAFCLE